MVQKKIIGLVDIPQERLSEVKEKIKSILDFRNEIKLSLYKSLTELVDIILAGAFFLDVSDIHFEPKEEDVKLRIRIDGVLHEVLSLNLKIYKSLLSRIKLLAELKLNVTDRPQDGRFSILIEGSSIEVRASSVPAEYGESIVLRILNPKWVVSMEELGLREDMLDVFREEAKKPNGMIICTGPTGAGKTTTLYAFLQKINDPGIKIITIEDPIEYHLAGVSQTQVDPAKGYDFANGLRAVVRQDPDVILVGEIRDLETAEISLQASLTGHLVLTTLHTNDAAGTIVRLTSLGAQLYNIAPALNLIVAQRLVRKICQKCCQWEKPSPETLTTLKENLKNIPSKIKIPDLNSPDLKIPKASGCQYCNFTGYRGRVGIFEIILVDDEIERFILTNPSIVELRELAIKKGMVLMRTDGFIKVLWGITTIDEVERVAGEQ